MRIPRKTKKLLRNMIIYSRWVGTNLKTPPMRRRYRRHFAFADRSEAYANMAYDYVRRILG